MLAVAQASGENRHLFSVEEVMLKANKNQLPASFTMSYSNTDGETFYVQWVEASTPEFMPNVKVIDHGEESTIPFSNHKRFRGNILKTKKSLATLSQFSDRTEIMLSSIETGNVFIAKEKSAHIQYAQEQPYLTVEDKVRVCHPEHASDTKILTRGTGDHTCKKVYVSITADYDLYTKLGLNTTRVAEYISSVMANVQAIYRSEEIQLGLSEIIIHRTPDAFRHLSALDDLNIFRFIRRTYDGHIALCLSGYEDPTGFAPLGGHAFISSLCNRSISYAYVNVDGAFNNYPNYSWDVFGISHELGHVIGSPHTHACAWGPSKNEALDNCAPPEGLCSEGPRVSRGTIMSYCHTPGNPGIYFSEGFGEEPGDLLRSAISNSACLNDFIPDQTQLRKIGLITANMECYDGQYTHYYYDNHTIEEEDDVLIMSLDKKGQDIGHVYDGSLTITSKYSSNMTRKKATKITAAYVPSGTDYFVMNKHWTIRPRSQPSIPIHIKLPYRQDDFNDVNTSVIQNLKTDQIKAFVIKPVGTADPALNHRRTTTPLYHEYEYGPSPSTTKWKHSSSGNTQFAEFKASQLEEFGLGAYSLPFLPVELHAFEGYRDAKNSVTLTWRTSAEINLDKFQIQRSTDGLAFEDIGHVTPQGAGSLYQYVDHHSNSHHYYRIKTTDVTGEYQLSNVIFLEVKSESPAPPLLKTNLITDHQLKLELPGVNGKVEVNVYTNMGQVVMCNSELVSGELTMSIHQLKPGVYYTKVITETDVLQAKFVVVR